MKTIVALCLVLHCASAFPASASACDRECLRGTITRVLYAFVEHDISKLPLAANLRVTEDGIEKTLDKVGLVRSVTKLRGYRQDIIDERAGVAMAGVMVEEAGAPILLVVRAKVVGEAISELELVATRSRADGMIYSIDTYSGAASKPMNLVPRPSQLASREKAIEIALLYPKGLSNAKTFDAVGVPFSPQAYRIENGALMAGPGCTFSPGCDRIGQQSLAIFERLGKVTVRDIVVDERMGIVMLRLSWNQRGPGSDKLTAWEMFKIYDGQVHMVEAYIRLFPPELDLGGWPVVVKQPE